MSVNADIPPGAPTIPRKAIIALAKRKALVQWWPSGIVEQLHFTPGTSGVFAKNILTGQSHRLIFRDKPCWFVREVQPTDYVRLGDLAPKR